MEGTERALILADGEFGGSYRFRYGLTCQSSDCTITFPVENVNVCSNFSCLVTRQGLKRKAYPVPNQDKSLLIEASDLSDFFMAVLADGHGLLGHLASEATIQELPTRILKNLDQGLRINSSINTAFLETDRGKLSYVPRGGTTAIVVYQNSSQVYIASAGDSTAMIVQWRTSPTLEHKHLHLLTSQEDLSPKYQIVASAKKHRPMDPEERSRIEANGGTVYVPALQTHVNDTVKDYSASTSGGRVIYAIPGPPPMHFGLAMSRSLGDLPAKRQQLVIPDPDIISIDLLDFERDDYDSQYFVILATDGVMDRFELDEVIVPLGNALMNGSDQSSNVTLFDTCQSILDKAASRWLSGWNNQYRDDMSLTVKKIEFHRSKVSKEFLET
jgi:serine/threonine protein phosphatase PrpC